MASERMRFILEGRDNLSREFNFAGRSAADLQRAIERASQQSRESLAGLQRDAQGRLRDVQGRFVSAARAAEMMGSDVDDAFDRVSHSADEASASLRKFKAAAVAAGAGAAVVAASAGAAALLSVAAAAGAASAGMAAFGLAIAPQVKSMSDALEASTKLTEATGKYGATSDEAAEAQAKLSKVIGSAGSDTAAAVLGFLSLTEAYKDWSKSVGDATMPVLTKSFATMESILPKLTPLVRGTAGELDRLVRVLAGMSQQPGFDRFVEDVTELSNSTLHRVTTEVANLSNTLASMDTSLWDRFMRLGAEHGPLVAETLRNVGEALANILLAAGDAGVSVLAVANALAQVVNAVPPEMLSTVVQLYATFKLFGAASAGVARLGVALAAVNARLATMRTSAAAATGAMGRVSAATAAMSAGFKRGVIVAGLALIAVGVAKLADSAKGAAPDIDRMTTALTRLADTGRFTGELRATFTDVDGLVKKIKQLRQETADLNRDPDGIRIPGLDDAAEGIARLIKEIKNGDTSISALEDDFGALDKSLASLVKSGHADVAAESFARVRAAAKSQGISMKELNGLVPEYRDALAAAKVAQEYAADSMGLFGQKALETTAKLEDQKASADGLRKAYHDLNTVMLEARGGIRGMEAAIDDASKSIKENGKTLDVTTEAGRANQAALDAIVSTTMKAVEAARKNGSTWSEVADIYDRGRGAFIRTRMELGATRKEATKLADRIFKMPDKTVLFKGEISDLDKKIKAGQRHVDSLKQHRATNLDADRGKLDAQVRKAQAHVNSLRQKRAALLKARDATGPGVNAAQSHINSLQDKTVDIFVNVWRRNRGNQSFVNKAPGYNAQGGMVRGYADGGEVQGFPGGGPVIGPGTTTSDSIPAMLSDGEFVMKAAAVQKYSVGMLDAMNQMRIPARPTSTAGGGRSSGDTHNATYNYTVNARTADFTPHQLEALTRRMDTLNRVGRPR